MKTKTQRLHHRYRIGIHTAGTRYKKFRKGWDYKSPSFWFSIFRLRRSGFTTMFKEFDNYKYLRWKYHGRNDCNFCLLFMNMNDNRYK